MKTLNYLIVSYAIIVTFFLNEQFFSCHLQDFDLRPKFKLRVNICFAEKMFSVSGNIKLRDVPKLGVLCKITGD